MWPAWPINSAIHYFLDETLNYWCESSTFFPTWIEQGGQYSRWYIDKMAAPLLGGITESLYGDKFLQSVA